jgi:glycerol-3-phosphate acyltransferase PlsY
MLLWILTGYLFGSFPSGYVFFRLFRGKDIRTLGSGNIGATNVGRFMGKKWAIIVAVSDMFKGGIAVLLAVLSGVTDPFVIAVTGFAGVLGHNFPIWLRFRGGKGVSTTFGVIMFFDPPLSFVVAALGGMVWFLAMKISRYVSLASLISLFSIPLLFILFRVSIHYVMVSLLLAILSTVRHQKNLRRIVEGTELKVGGNGEKH